MEFIKEHPEIKFIQTIAKRRGVVVHLVGGFLRDYLLGKTKTDFDFAVERDALKLAKSFARKIKGAFVLLDKERGCARVAKKKKGELFVYDFADYRAKTLPKDLTLRDFTINTFSVDLSEITSKTRLEDVIKDYEKGMKDLKLKRIKMTSGKVFKEDPLRLLRAFSMKAVLNFKIDAKTKQQIKKDLTGINDVSYERIREELFKVLESPRAAQNIREMDKIGLLERVIPQVRAMFTCKQGAYHHLNVWPHSLETVVQLERIFKEKEKDKDIRDYLNETIGGLHSRRSIIKLAMLLHDIGKPDTRKKEGERVSFHAHERVGKKIVREVSKMLKVSRAERYALEDMVLWHLRPGYLSNFKKPSERAIFRYFRDTQEEAVSILLLSLADQRSTCGPLTTARDQKHHENICLKLVNRYFRKKKQKPMVRLLNGNDILKKCKLKPSPLVGKIIEAIEEKQSLGKFTTKAEAISFAKSFAKKSKSA